MPRITDIRRSSHRQGPGREEDEFLKESLLFKLGPALLVGAGLLLGSLVFMAAQWRVTAGIEGANHQAFQLTRRMAMLSQDQMAETLSAVAVATRRLQEGTPPELALLDVALPLGLEAMLVAPSGKVLWSFHPSVHRHLLPLADSLADNPTMNLVVFPEAPSPFEATAKAIRVTAKLGNEPQSPYVIFFLDTASLLRKVGRIHGPGEVWLRVAGHRGQPLAETQAGTREPPGYGPERPLLTELDVKGMSLAEASAGMVTASASTPSGLRMTVSLPGSVLFRDITQRVAATWMIAQISAGFVLLMAGITACALRQFRHKERALRRLATLDSLTGLPNHRSFHELMALTLKKSEKSGATFALFFIDLDNFKFINDSLGHRAGDELLCKVAAALKASVRENSRVCRLGGDEFVIISEAVGTSEDAAAMGARLLVALRQLSPSAKANVKVRANPETRLSASGGVVLFQGSESSASELLHAADMAMRTAKKRGKSRCEVYTHAMRESARARALVAMELGDVIENGSDEVTVCAPEVEVHPGQMLGYAARPGWDGCRRWRK